MKQPASRDAARAVREASGLLDSATIDTSSPLLLDGKHVSILVRGYPSEKSNLVRLAVTVVARAPSGPSLEGALLALSPAGADGGHRRGTLDNRGQYLFRDLQPGLYSLGLLEPGKTRPSRRFVRLLDFLLTSFPAQQVTAAPAAATADASASWKRVYAPRSGWLRATVEEWPGRELGIVFESPGRRYDGALVVFTWRADGPGASTTVEPERLLAPLTWNEITKACDAEMSLGRIPVEFDLSLPEEPLAAGSLTADAAKFVQASIIASASDKTRRGWKNLLGKDGVAPQVRAAIRVALKG